MTSCIAGTVEFYKKRVKMIYNTRTENGIHTVQ